MHTLSRKTVLVAGLFLLAIIGIPSAIFLSQQNQDDRSRASAATTLAFEPAATNAAPIEKNLGESVAIDVMVDPGSNLPSHVTLEMQFDETTLQANQDAFAVNATAFPLTIEGPIYESGKVLISVSIGNDATKAIQTKTKVGTLTLQTIAGTEGNASEIRFGPRSGVLSIGTQDQASENVLATTMPTYVTIINTEGPTIIPTIPTQIPTVSLSPSPQATITPSVIPSPTISSSGTVIKLDVLLHGIGRGGDNANPNEYTLSNKEPAHRDRDVIVWIYDDSNILTASKAGTITYQETTGNFIGEIDFGSRVPTGDYTVRVKEPTHLAKRVPGIQQLVQGQANQIRQIALVAGDVNNDNVLNIIDYNALIGCYSDLLPPVSCDDATAVLTDLNDDVAVNQFDYNLFLREITVQTGN